MPPRGRSSGSRSSPTPCGSSPPPPEPMAIASREVAEAIPDRSVRHRLGREDLARYALVALFALILGLFVLYPMGQLAWRSLLDNQGRFVGAANYARYFSTPAIASSITNSLHVS